MRCFFLAEALDVSVCKTLTAHWADGDTMVSFTRVTQPARNSVTELLPKEQLDRNYHTHHRRRRGEIVGLLKTGSAFYAPSLGAVEMAANQF